MLLARPIGRDLPGDEDFADLNRWLDAGAFLRAA